jgi:SAM-dependent methyltransferase
MRAGRGHGPGAIAPDGSPVELYVLLPPTCEPAIIDEVAPPGSTILELGSGTGRVTGPLVALGHSLVAVDESAEMLEHLRERVPDAQTVHSDFEHLRLDRRFEVVLLGSNLLNAPDRAERRTMLATCRRHVADRGMVLVEWLPPEWFDTVAPRVSELGEMTITLHDLRREGNLLHASVSCQVGGRAWRQDFTGERLTEPELHGELAEAGLALDDWLTDDRSWFCATPVP